MVRPIVAGETLARLKVYAWPGNVRELRNIIERLVVRNRAGLIPPEDLPAAVSGAVPPPKPTADMMYDRMVGAGESFWTAVHRPFQAHDVTREDLRALVARGLRQTRGNYKGLLALFNLPVQDYKRFVEFLRKHECRLPFVEFRVTPALSARFSEPANSSPLSAKGG